MESGCGTDHFCLFRCNNVEFSVQMGSDSVCWDVERMSFVFFDVTTSSSLFRWETVQSVGMWNGPVLSFSMLQRRNAELSVQMGNGSVCWDVERLL